MKTGSSKEQAIILRSLRQRVRKFIDQNGTAESFKGGPEHVYAGPIIINGKAYFPRRAISQLRGVK
jgi:hypothetical protein